MAILKIKKTKLRKKIKSHDIQLLFQVITVKKKTVFE